ncbi:hypothetical protein [Mycolicibacter sinensis]|uniref:hypothetical protein n=1 Tax=Mycolicibacter sinensis (strain JDM601) TaxID=875328 RepID=UPI001300DA2C|nr:hypothetical protein [Mycolicibacter sinensis]
MVKLSPAPGVAAVDVRSPEVMSGVPPGVASGAPVTGKPPVSPIGCGLVASGADVSAPRPPSSGAFASGLSVPTSPSGAVPPVPAVLLVRPTGIAVLPMSPAAPTPLSAEAIVAGRIVVVSSPAVAPPTDNMIRRFIWVRSFRL